MTLVRFADAKSAAEGCGARILELLADARRERGVASVAVSGGSTPKIMFEWMAAQEFDWRGIEFFFVDERCVAPDHELSNFRMTREAMLDRIAIAPERVHRIQGELEPSRAAAIYAAEIAAKLGETPVFDVIQRGLGGDMHTASLFPGEALITDRTGIAAATYVEKMGQHRVTLLPGVLERARYSLCLVSGADKAAALRGVFYDPYDPMRMPGQIAAADSEWFCDEAACAQLIAGATTLPHRT